jgi:hypothetical protein
MPAEVHNGAQAAPVTELLKGIVNDVGELVRQEVRFARKEIGSDLRKTQAATTSLALGGAVVLVGTILLAIALALVLPVAFPGLAYWASFGIVAVVLLVAGGSLAYAGYAKFQTFTPIPEKTIATIQENVTGVPQPIGVPGDRR